MTDVVNDFFRKYYPDDWNSAWEQEYCVGGYAKRYSDRSVDTIFPQMVCADGFTMSVQGHFGAYSHPRDDFADHYSAVEIMCVSDPILESHGNSEDCGTEKIYGYVPIYLVERMIAAHGGLV